MVLYWRVKMNLKGMTKAELFERLKDYPDDRPILIFDELRKEWKEITVVSQTRVKYNGIEAGISFYNYDLHNTEAEMATILN
jgi:hypothetical protein